MRLAPTQHLGCKGRRNKAQQSIPKYETQPTKMKTKQKIKYTGDSGP